MPEVDCLVAKRYCGTTRTPHSRDEMTVSLSSQWTYDGQGCSVKDRSIAPPFSEAPLCDPFVPRSSTIGAF